MAGKTGTALKQYFLDKAKPTESQFYELIDSLYEKAQSILPQDNNSFNIGTDLKRFKDLYLSANADIVGYVKAALHKNTAVFAIDCVDDIDVSLNVSNVMLLEVTSPCNITFTQLTIGSYKLIVKQTSTGFPVTFDNHHIAGSVSRDPAIIDVLDITCDGGNVYINVTNNFSTI